MLVERGRSGDGEGVTKVLNLISSKRALLQVDYEGGVEHMAEMQLMVSQGNGEDEYIVKIIKTEG